MKKIILPLLFILSILLGFYEFKLKPDQLKEQLRERVALYWDSVRINDFLTLYTMETTKAQGLLQPHQVKKRTNFDVRLVSFELGPIKMLDSSSAEIDVHGQYTMMEFEGKTYDGGIQKDRWTLIDHQWYHGDLWEPSQKAPAPKDPSSPK